MKQHSEVKSFGIAILLAAASDLLQNSFYHRLMLMVAILVMIYSLITHLKFTIYQIKHEERTHKSWFSVKIDYWLLFAKNILALGSLLAIYFVSVYVNNQFAWLIIPLLIVLMIGLIMFESKLNKKSGILESESESVEE